MKRFTRLSLLAFALCLSVVGVVYADLDLAERWGFDFWNYSQFEQELTESQRIHSHLSSSQEQTRWRLEYREQLLEELVMGRLTIDQAIRQFQSLNQNCQLSPEMLRFLYKAKDDQCVAARQLLRYVEGYARNEDRYQPLKGDVEKWLETHFPQ